MTDRDRSNDFNGFGRTALGDLHQYARRANERIFSACRKLADEQLDEAEPIGFGSLRDNLCHVYAAERLWLDRFKGRFPEKLPHERVSTDELERRFDDIAVERSEFLDAETDRSFRRRIEYKTLAQEPTSARLIDLLTHVFNHGVHHRAQALQSLKRLGVTFPIGIDYILHRFAEPTVEIAESSKAVLRAKGIEVGDRLVEPFEHQVEFIIDYFNYSEWANERLFEALKPIENDSTALDRDFGIGPGTIRKTLAHLANAEDYWNSNWTGEGRKESSLKPGVSRAVPDLKEDLVASAKRRNDLLASMGDADLMRTVEFNFGFGPLILRTGESMLQVCVHGTHHRSQMINMMRRLGIESPGYDLVIKAMHPKRA